MQYLYDNDLEKIGHYSGFLQKNCHSWLQVDATIDL